MPRKKTITGWSEEDVKGLTLEEIKQLREATLKTLSNIDKAIGVLQPNRLESFSLHTSNPISYYSNPTALENQIPVNDSTNTSSFIPPKRNEVSSASAQLGKEILKSLSPEDGNYFAASSPSVVQPQTVKPKEKTDKTDKPTNSKANNAKA